MEGVTAMLEWEETKKWKAWYLLPFVRYEMVKCLKNRELAFLKSKVERLTELETHSGERGFWANSLNYLDKHFGAYDFYKKNWCLYYSLSTLRGVPVFSYSPPVRKEQRKQFFQVDYADCWKGYDFALDIDSDKISEAHKSAEKVKAIFDSYGLPYSLRFSGLQGFHFVVKYENFFPPEWELNKCVEMAKTIAYTFSEVENIDYIDLKIYQKDRLLKLPYSLIGLNVCLPLDDKDFKEFELKKMHVDYVLKHSRIRDRGILEREGLSINSLKFIDMYGGI